MSNVDMHDLDLGIIGNCTIAGLINKVGSMNWLCLPRLDGQPVFDALLNGQGSFSIHMDDLANAEQHYVPNTAILVTTLTSKKGDILEITDFAPRFNNRGRTFRPTSFVRHLRRKKGSPRVRIELNPQGDWGERPLDAKRGVSHIKYDLGGIGFRVTTNMPVSYLAEGTEFNMEGDIAFICGPDDTVSENPTFLANDWEDRTRTYWKSWTRRLAVPLDWQAAVIRAAITLKVCVYEETGGIVAALTTSIPEHHGSERNWDYRFCWIRDSYFTVTALNRLSAVGTMEHYSRFLRNVVAMAKGGHIQPVFGIGLETDLTEHIVDALPGYRNHPPVRRGNQAAEHIQHDVYGQVVLSAAPAFFDERLLNKPGIAEFEQLEPVGERAYQVHNTPDAGIWEFRGFAHVHTSSAIMCWAACDRLSKIAAHLGEKKKAKYWETRAAEIHVHILDKAYNADINAFTAYYGGDSLDASVLLMAEIGFIDPMDPRYVGTVEAVNNDLREGDFVFRYKTEDDFGRPETAFTVCTFWQIDALYRIGREDEARKMFENVLARRNHLGLLSEDMHPVTNELWGNYPQTYSMVGIINSANLMSRKWTDVV